MISLIGEIKDLLLTDHFRSYSIDPKAAKTGNIDPLRPRGVGGKAQLKELRKGYLKWIGFINV
jgi:hypothetical protein